MPGGVQSWPRGEERVGMQTRRCDSLADVSAAPRCMSVGISFYFAISFKPFTTNKITLGYPKKGDPERTLIFEHAGIEIGYGNPEWGAPIDRMVFIIKHGKRIEL